jgi:TldD protein
MSELIKLATHSLLNPVDLNEQTLEAVLGRAMGPSIDMADIFLQSTHEESWMMEDGLVKNADYSIEHGFGLRVISGEKTGFAYADDINEKALAQAAKAATSIVHGEFKKNIPVVKENNFLPLYSDSNPLTSMKEEDKVALLKQLDQYARQKDPRVKQVMISLSGQYDVVMVMNSDGVLAADIRPLVNLSVRVVVEQKGRRERGTGGGGARCGYEWFTDDSVALSYVDKAVNQALLNLEADAAPAGTMPVVLAPGWPAVLLHEAVGHGLEGDFNRKESSAFSGRLGERVASSLCTVVDDGTIAGRRGSLSVDDEGTKTENSVLIEGGVLKNYMQDRHNAKLMKMAPTGNGRRESYSHLPMPRMTNTYMLPGESDPQEIISSVEKGLYAVDFLGGQVDITSGKFVFSTSEAYLIEKGKITRPIKGATLIGNGPDVLTQVSMVGNDLALDSGIGSCGKSGQTVPVGVGQPTVKVDKLTVGGVE